MPHPDAREDHRVLHNAVRTLLVVTTLAVACSPSILAMYIQWIGGSEKIASAPVFHVIVITLAIAFSAFATYVAYQAYRASGKPFLKWLLLGMISFTVIYSPHGFLTTIALDAGNPWVFLLFGPASRLVLAGCFLLASLSYGRQTPATNTDTAHATVWRWSLLCLGICMGVYALAWSPIASERFVRWSMEFGAMALLAASVAALWIRGGRSGFSYTFMAVQFVFIQASFAFLFAPMWSHSWWFAHIIYAGGFLLLTYQVATVFLGGVSFEDVFSTTELLEDLKKANQRYERSNGDLSQFAHTVSHDLQAPLRRMNSFVDLVDEEIKGLQVSEQLHFYLGVIRENSQNLRDLVTRILDFSSAGSRSLEYSLVDLNLLLAEVTEIFENELLAIQGTCDVQTDLPTICGDRVLLFQVFQNLIQNAIKYRCPEKPLQIKVNAHAQGRGWVIDVADNGRGFPMSDAPKVFQMLSRLHAADTSGTGAGLAICSRIVDRHGGKIDVHAAPREGATFHVYLPEQQPL